jgi:hypothetical protein
MLFILAIDPLQSLLNKATEQGLLHPIGVEPVKLRTSLYADDVALFLCPIASDVQHLHQLLNSFGSAMGLCTNIQKSHIFPINCEGTDISSILGQFQGTIEEFPCRYLGLPLRIGKTRRVDEQILVDKVVAKLPHWKGRLLNKAGRLTLINSVLSSIVIHHMTVFQLSKWAIKKIDQIRHAFMWRGNETATDEHCMVNWRRILRPKRLGGLGILDLARFNRALRLRWQWLVWKTEGKPWSAMTIPVSETEAQLFHACTSIVVGNGQRTKF